MNLNSQFPERIIQKALTDGTPVVEGDQVHFLWQGEESTLLVGDFTDWARGIPKELISAGKQVWFHTETFPEEAYIEYAYLDSIEQTVLDPLNVQKVANGFGKYNNYFYMPKAKPTNLIRRMRGTPRGSLTVKKLPTGKYLPGSARRVAFYQPISVQPVPLLLVYDGNNYLYRGKLLAIVDNLIAAGRMQPIAMAMINHGRGSRHAEYGCSDATLAFIAQTVLPAARLELNILDLDHFPGAYGVLGASMGGLMAVYTGLRMPDVFGQTISQSGAFQLENFTPVVFDLVKHLPRIKTRIWLDVGLYDIGYLLTGNRSFQEYAQIYGCEVVYREYAGGHNFTSWRNEVWRALEWAFPAVS